MPSYEQPARETAQLQGAAAGLPSRMSVLRIPAFVKRFLRQQLSRLLGVPSLESRMYVDLKAITGQVSDLRESCIQQTVSVRQEVQRLREGIDSLAGTMCRTQDECSTLQSNLCQTQAQLLTMSEAVVADLQVVREQLLSKLEASSAELQKLRDAFFEERRIDLIQVGPFRNFMFRDDCAVRQLRARFADDPGALEPKTDLKAQRADHGAGSPAAYSARWQPPHQALFRVLTHLWEQELGFTIFDIGCQYGSSAMELASFVQAMGRRNKVIAFDPGLAGQLARLNIENNGYADQVEFYPHAVSDSDGFLLLFREFGQSENNRVVNRFAQGEVCSYPVRRISLDSYVDQQQLQGYVAVKIDTQGGEYEVRNGMKRLLSQDRICGVMEFTPWALRPRVDPVLFLQEFLDSCYVFNLGPDDGCLERIRSTAADSFVEDINASQAKWTDLLFFPQRLPGANQLLPVLEGRSGARRQLEAEWLQFSARGRQTTTRSL